ncbi:MAG: hypothetical protein MMC33_008548, partial [Icmadophila ericetorum]|nr:hypothetical protein [Icmadophila ericetorum]
CIDRSEQRGLDLKLVDHSGMILLHCAAVNASCSSSIIHFLVKKGIHPLVADSEGRTPLHVAAIACNETAVVALAEEYLSDSNPAPPLQLCILSLETDLSQLTSLQMKKLNEFANVVDDVGRSPLHFLALERRRWNDEDGELDFKETFRLLVKFGADINKPAADGATPLSYHVQNLTSCLVKALLAQGALLDVADGDGRTSLHHAAWLGRDDYAKMLLDRGANPNLKEDTLQTALHLACRKGHFGVVDILLKKNVDCTVQDIAGVTPLHLLMDIISPRCSSLYLGSVSSDRRIEDLENIIENSEHTTEGSEDATEDSQDMTEHYTSIFIENWADVNAVDNLGRTPLHWAAKRGQKVGVTILLAHCADLNVTDYTGRTAQDLAVRYAAIVEDDGDSIASDSDRIGSVKPKRGIDKRKDGWRRSGHLPVWLALYKASEKIRQEQNRHPTTSLKRSQSTIHRMDQPWDDFTSVKTRELNRLDPLSEARHKYGNISPESLCT